MAFFEQNELGDESAAALAAALERALPGCGLTHVDLQMCEIGEAGEQALGALCGDGNDMDLVYEDGVLRSRSDGVGSEPRYKFSN